MVSYSSSLRLLLDMTAAQSAMHRRFDGRLGGLSLTEFLILTHLEQSKDAKMRRVDLAERVGLTQSGVTRLLAPMEKIGLVKRATDPGDARVSFVELAPGGRRSLKDAIENAEELANRLLARIPKEHVVAATGVMKELGSAV